MAYIGPGYSSAVQSCSMNLDSHGRTFERGRSRFGYNGHDVPRPNVDRRDSPQSRHQPLPWSTPSRRYVSLPSGLTLQKGALESIMNRGESETVVNRPDAHRDGRVKLKTDNKQSGVNDSAKPSPVPKASWSTSAACGVITEDRKGENCRDRDSARVAKFQTAKQSPVPSLPPKKGTGQSRRKALKDRFSWRIFGR
ncbi:hypothetical protein DCS_04053 [Drechmeria coniospora]|uniref:Uncharacterized protein n=1 Tax=Drechmeria coniospora TaxID=98403 RepID=A0A151GIX9_DRECN|nr:hypothetical protein DCS_04053 [Drechmeria coniospora]KYK57046.1 hypothetical protein DCS_04053 [Drechmeria coniospora]ODA79928.1 hypothetical protein RJ55_05525 [Drechmeria coniospora]